MTIYIFKRGQEEMYIRVCMHFPTDDAYVVSNFQGLQTGLLHTVQ